MQCSLLGRHLHVENQTRDPLGSCPNNIFWEQYLKVFCSLFLMVFHTAVQMQPAPGFKKLLQVLHVKLGIIGGTVYFGTLIAMQSMLRNKNYGPKPHENWQVTFISLLSTAYCKHSKSDLKIYVEDNSIAIPPSLPDLHPLLEWKRRLGALCLTEDSTILQESREAS